MRGTKPLFWTILTTPKLKWYFWGDGIAFKLVMQTRIVTSLCGIEVTIKSTACHIWFMNPIVLGLANRECYIVRTSDNIYGEINEYFIVGGGHCTNKTSYHLAITSNKTLGFTFANNFLHFIILTLFGHSSKPKCHV